MLQHPVVRSIPAADNRDETTVLRFDAALAIQAIVYHVVDEGLARSVAPEAIRRTLGRLAGKTFSAAITRRRWITMTNAQRLKWLLKETRTTMFGDEGSVMLLRARRGK